MIKITPIAASKPLITLDGKKAAMKPARARPWAMNRTIGQPVELTAADGQVHRYIFLLRRQDEGRYHGCWMTDGVIRPEGETAPALHET